MMSDKRISDLVELTTLAADDVLPVVDADANATKRVTYDTLATEVRTESEPLSATTVTASGDVSADTATIAGDITSNGETVYHRGNVVGTVSESGGDVMGAVIERDSNGNGEYVKFADGTMICQQTFTGVAINNNSDVTNLRYGEVLWQYPVEFSGRGTVYGHRRGAGGMGVGVYNEDNDEAEMRFWDNNDAPRTGQTCFAVAIGRWY